MKRRDSTTIEAQLEDAWNWLTEQPIERRVRYYVTTDGRLKRGDGEGEEVGVFTRAVHLADFREAVFEVYAQLRRAVHGSR